MKETTINALYFINTQGYDNSKWNCEKNPTHAGYYGDVEKKELPAHIAIYVDETDDLEYIKSHAEPDVILHVQDYNEMIMVYYL